MSHSVQDRPRTRTILIGLNHRLTERALNRSKESIDVSEPQPIIGFHQDQQQHWVAQLACGHFQHVRHDPPMVSRDWVTTESGRKSMIGHHLDCIKCADGAPPDE